MEGQEGSDLRISDEPMTGLLVVMVLVWEIDTSETEIGKRGQEKLNVPDRFLI